MNLKLLQSIVLIPFLGFTLSSCEVEEKEPVHIIKQRADEMNPPFYGSMNIIFTKEGKIFYYTFDMNSVKKGSSLTKPDATPMTIGLKKEMVKEIQYEQLMTLLEPRLKEKFYFTISSPSDSIYNENFLILFNTLQRTGSKSYWVRHTTTEENEMIK